MIAPLYLKKVEGVSSVTIEHLDLLFEAFKNHFGGRKKLIIAFRHVAKEDAPVLMYLIHKKLKKAIRTYNRTVAKKERIIGHAQFLYGADVLEWAGTLAAYVFPRLGAIPVINRTNNSKGLSLLKETMKKGEFPVALAPESQVTYHMGTVAQTSKGITSLAFWGENVSIIPIGMGYHYHNDSETFINHVIEKWEKETNINIKKDQHSLYESLILMTQETLKLLENFYHLPFNSELPLKERIEAICLKAMGYAEYIAHTKGNGSLLDRLFHIRHMGIMGQKPENFEALSNSPLASSLLDIKALHAHLFLIHSQIIDVLEYVDPSYIFPPTSLHRMSEYALNILDVINRMKGGNINSRYSPKGKHAFVYIGESLNFEKNADVSRKEMKDTVLYQVNSALQEVSSKLEEKWMEVESIT
jgi:hypothetical protein